MKIIGISAFYHDSAAALVVDGHIVAAAQEERFTRIKHDAGFPNQALAYCLKEGRTPLAEIDYVAFFDKPFIKFERLLETYLAMAPRGFTSFRTSFPIWIKEKLFQKRLIEDALKEVAPEIDWSKKLLFGEHHQSHAASAFFPSPFQDAAILTMDGVGEWATSSLAIGRGNKLEMQKEIHFPHSMGLLYSAFTYYLGFKVNSGEYKVMGLAPYGRPLYKDIIFKHLIDLKPDGSYHLNMKHFDYCTGLRMTNQSFADLFELPARKAEELLTQKHMDIAASLQAALEDVMITMTRSIHQETGLTNLCLAGGVALNCVANGKILRDGRMKNIWIQPASGDAGGAVGAALGAYHIFLNQPRVKNSDPVQKVDFGDGMRGAYLGPENSDEEIRAELTKAGAVFERVDDETIIQTTAEALANEEAIGWFQGRMEFGPRSLGNRSIIADARSPRMQKNLNLKIKFRESFRPFAPAVLREDVNQWFDLDEDSPYMLLVASVQESKRRALDPDHEKLFGIDQLNLERSEIPAVTHVDYSARVQTVDKRTNPKFHKLIAAFKAKTQCSVLVNTSFNVRGEPIVCSPTDAFRCFMGTNLDRLVVGNYILKKADQNPELLLDYKNKFELD